ncbi:MAG: DUF2304 domain-containing protein [Lachnospiraceae bacterium]|jgi:hypothetical protein|nr:DUF2304 domain-containing protein [Lachnospiraceae bacterium]
MTVVLRVLLLLASLFTAFMIMRKIRKCRIKQEDTLFWIVFSVMLALLGIFPGISYSMGALLGIHSPANFVYLVIIALLVEKLLSVSIQVSMLESKVEVLSAELAIRCKDLQDHAAPSSEKEPAADSVPGGTEDRDQEKDGEK